MSMVRHIKGFLQMFHHNEHTYLALVTMPTTPTLWSMFSVNSLGSSSQFGHIVLSPFACFVGLEHDAIMLIEQYNAEKNKSHTVCDKIQFIEVCNRYLYSIKF